MRAFVVLPCGGASRRFGSPKLLADWQGQPLLAHVIQVFLPLVDRVVAVVRPDLPELAEVAGAVGAAVCRLPALTPGMRETVELGLAWLEKHDRPADRDVWFLLPADSPGITPAVVRSLLDAAAREPWADVILPTCNGQRGHPVLPPLVSDGTVAAPARGAGNQSVPSPVSRPLPGDRSRRAWHPLGHGHGRRSAVNMWPLSGWQRR